MDKRIRDLDDVEKHLREQTTEDIIERNRKRRRRQQMERQRRRNLRRDMGILAIPAIILILMVVIVILDHTTGSVSVEDANAAAQESTAATETAESAAETGAASEEDNTVKEYNDDVLEDFFNRYFTAKLNADVDTIYRMSGVTNQTEEQAAQLRSQLKTQAGYIEKYQDIKLYAVKGLEDNSKLVFVTYNVKFRRADTLAPAIMYCYIKVNEQNEFELVENMSPEQTKFVNEYTQNHDEVKELINSQDSKLLAALSSDARLAVIYDAFQTGRIYKEDQSAIDSEVSLISVATEAETTTAAETEDSSTEKVKSTTAAEKETESRKNKSDSNKETTKDSSKETAKETKESSKETAAQQSGSVIEAGGDPGQQTTNAVSPGSNSSTAAETAGNAPAQGGDVIEGQDLQ